MRRPRRRWRRPAGSQPKRSADPQLGIVEKLTDDVAKKLEPLKGRMVYAAYAKTIAGLPHFLVISFARSRTGGGQ